MKMLEMTMTEPLTYRAPSLQARLAMREEPEGAPLMYQTWSNLLFLHWEWDRSEIQKTLPPGLHADTFEGKAYLAVTPFFMKDVRAAVLPPIPGAANFLELNVRTYVYDQTGRPGVWFYSLDCNQRLAVAMARLFYSLPYQSAEMEARERAGIIEYTCRRMDSGPSDTAEFHYRRLPETVGSQPGSLPFFLAERYLLFAYSRRAGKLYTARVHHAPYELFHSQVGRHDDTMLRLNGFQAKLRPPDLAWMASPLRVKAYALEKAGPAETAGHS